MNTYTYRASLNTIGLLCCLFTYCFYWKVYGKCMESVREESISQPSTLVNTSIPHGT